MHRYHRAVSTLPFTAPAVPAFVCVTTALTIIFLSFVCVCLHRHCSLVLCLQERFCRFLPLLVRFCRVIPRCVHCHLPPPQFTVGFCYATARRTCYRFLPVPLVYAVHCRTLPRVTYAAALYNSAAFKLDYHYLPAVTCAPGSAPAHRSDCLPAVPLRSARLPLLPRFAVTPVTTTVCTCCLRAVYYTHRFMRTFLHRTCAFPFAAPSPFPSFFMTSCRDVLRLVLRAAAGRAAHAVFCCRLPPLHLRFLPARASRRHS